MNEPQQVEEIVIPRHLAALPVLSVPKMHFGGT